MVDHNRNGRLSWLAIGVVAVIGALLAGIAIATRPSKPAAPVLADTNGRFPKLDRVALLVLENRSYDEVIGSPDAPYINRLARRYALAERYYAIGHPSLPNYVALTGGSTFEIQTNCAGCDTSAPNLVTQLDTARISWKAYFEGLTSNALPGPASPIYNPHYNPFVYFETVRGRAADRSRILSFRSLRDDLVEGRLPRFSWIAPGVRHDGHNSSLRAADDYASFLVPLLLRSLGAEGVLFLTWDEGASMDTSGVKGARGGGHVVLIAAGGAARRGATTGVRANHYALLRTIEAGFGLVALGNAASSTTPLLAGLVRPG
jgi:phosphatidylinositol-3-phosphatase